MFGRTDDDNRDRDRGQVGIGTLIVFIAMVLVAAIAAGVLINTAGFLQSKSEAAGQQSGDQVTNRLEVASATGSVDQSSGEVTSVDMTVKQAPGAQNVDMRNVTVSWVESGGTFKLVHNRVAESSTDADGRFATTAFKDSDGSLPVINDPDDRFTMVFDVGPLTRDGSFSNNGTNVDETVIPFGDNLNEGSIVTVQMTTQSGATTNARLVVPQSLSGTSAVNL
jgi:flagellin FlaB